MAINGHLKLLKKWQDKLAKLLSEMLEKNEDPEFFSVQKARKFISLFVRCSFSAWRDYKNHF